MGIRLQYWLEVCYLSFPEELHLKRAEYIPAVFFVVFATLIVLVVGDEYTVKRSESDFLWGVLRKLNLVGSYWFH